LPTYLTLFSSRDHRGNQACASTLESFCAVKLPLAQKTVAAVDGLRVMLVESLQMALADGVPVDEDAEGGEPGPKSFQVLAALTRVVALGHEFDLPAFDLLPGVISVIERGGENDVHETVMTVALELSVMLAAYAVGEVAGSGEECVISQEAADSVKELVEARNALVMADVALLESGTERVQRAAYAAIVDMLIIFSPAMCDAGVNVQFHPLALSLDADVQVRLLFVSFVFVCLFLVCLFVLYQAFVFVCFRPWFSCFVSFSSSL
jgi:hypothetical protein